MAKVYIVTIRKHKRAFFAEPCEYDTLSKVFDSNFKATGYIYDLIKKDHEYVDSEIAAGKTYFFKGRHTERLAEGWFTLSYGRKSDTYYESTSYMYKSYDVE